MTSDPATYRTGQLPRIGDTVRLVDVGDLWNCDDSPAAPGEYRVDDVNCVIIPQLLLGSLLWCEPFRCELVEEFPR